MSGRFGGQQRAPGISARHRRNWDKLASAADIFVSSGLILLDDGSLGVNLGSNSGLATSSDALSIDLRDTDPGLELSATGLGVVIGGGLAYNGSGAITASAGQGISVGTTISTKLGPGLVFNGSGEITHRLGAGLTFSGTDVVVRLNTTTGVNADGGNGLIVNTSGLYTRRPTTALRGTPYRQALVADVSTLTDNSGGTSGSGTIAAIGDTSNAGSADLAATQNAIATLAAYCTDLENKINEMIAAQKTADQMSTS